MTLPLERKKIVFLGTLSIPNAGTDSPVLDADVFGQFEAITVFAPATVTGTITVQVGIDDANPASAFDTLQSPPGTDVALAGAKAITISPPCFPQFRIHSSAAEAAQRDFKVWARYASVTSP